MHDSLGAWVIWITYGGFLLFFLGLGAKSIYEMWRDGVPSWEELYKRR
jgi:hypothetical protein